MTEGDGAPKLITERSTVPSKTGVIGDENGGLSVGRGNSNPVGQSKPPIQLRESKISEIVSFQKKQLDRKFKHATDFGITGNKNNANIKVYENVIREHLSDPLTQLKGTYLLEPGSKVYFNPKTNNIVIIDKNANFVSGWKLSPGTPQFNKFIKDGILR